MPDYQRPANLRFEFAGVNLRKSPDAMAPNEYAAAQNVRCFSGNTLRTRPGYVAQFTAAAARPITDIRAIATLETDDLPRFFARDDQNHIILDTGVTKLTLTGTTGKGVCMLPFRPNRSPQAWMYVASIADYQKLSAPDATNAVATAKVGVAEPSTAIEACPNKFLYTDFTGLAAAWTPAGTAGATADVALLTDTVAAIYADPVVGTRYSVQVTLTKAYQAGEVLNFNSGAFYAVVEEVWPQIGSTSIQSIRYTTGSTGHCVIVPTQLPSEDFGRGSLVKLNAAEVVLVLSVTTGSSGLICFETATVGTYSAGQSIEGIPAVVVNGIDASVVGNTITSAVIDTLVNAGVGTVSKALGSSPFSTPFGGSTILPQNADYVHVLFNISDPAKVAELKIIFNVGPTVDYVSNVYSISFTGADLTDNFFANLTDLRFPITSLQAKVGDQTMTLAHCNGVQLYFNMTDANPVQYGSVWVGGGGQPDVANNSPYYYRGVPRSSASGAVGNPTPIMRYGVNPHRQSVLLSLPATTYDSQLDTWDVYRYGGIITSYRFIGSTAAGAATTFTDDNFDTAANGGAAIELDNFEPYPSIDVPWSVTSVSATITLIGTELVISGYSDWPATIDRWLPGTLIQVGGYNAFTLRARPTQLIATSYLFKLQECGGTIAAAASLWVNEPLVARQPAPYMWGPDENGTVFAVGDPLRPGNVYFAKNYQPDSVRDIDNIELTPPSEPLLGGICTHGVSLVGSTKRWWALYPSASWSALGTGATTANRYRQIEQPVGRPLICPYGHCTDGENVYFWTLDGIVMTAGSGFKSLTDERLYPLFPHENVSGANITRAGVTYYAPDYSRAATFRLSYGNGYLFADYQDSTSTPRTLVCYLPTMAWSSDSYHHTVTCHYVAEQQPGTITTVAPALYPHVVMGSISGAVYRSQDLNNDFDYPITAILNTFEYDGGDQRADMQWGGTCSSA